MGLTYVVVVVTMPHNRGCVRAAPFTVWVAAGFARINTSGLEPVWRSDTPSHYGLKRSPLPTVASVVMERFLGSEVTNCGMVVESGAGSDHVLAVARWFRSVGFCNWLVNSLLQMV